VSHTTTSLDDIFRLEQIGTNRFEAGAFGIDGRRGRLFGGYLIARVLYALAASLPGSRVQSLQLQFVAPGTSGKPMTVDVSEIRSGRTFVVRRADAAQDGQLVVTGQAVLRRPAAPKAAERVAVELAAEPPPPSVDDSLWPSGVQAWFDVRFEPVADYSGDLPLIRRTWVKPRADATESLTVDCLVACVSDLGAASGGHRPSMEAPLAPGTRVSLDHGLWLANGPPPKSDWLIIEHRLVVEEGDRGLSVGRVYSRDGQQLAAMTQQSLALNRGATNATQASLAPRMSG
jgi:acyl-CoA thioesterase-2